MGDHVEPTSEPPVAELTAAQRMRRSRERRREGLRCLTVELRETEITSLIRRRLLTNENRSDMRAVRRALYQFLDSTLGEQV